jgi:hypothetical protein
MSDDRQGDDPGHFLYEIRVDGLLDERWSQWLNGLSLRPEQNETVLTAAVPDQAALRGLLNRIWDLNLEVISLSRLRPETGSRGASFQQERMS